MYRPQRHVMHHLYKLKRNIVDALLNYDDDDDDDDDWTFAVVTHTH